MARESTAKKLPQEHRGETDEELIEDAHASRYGALVVEAKSVVTSAQQKEETNRLWSELGRMKREKGEIAKIIGQLYKGESEEKITERVKTAEDSLAKRIIAKEERLKELAGKKARVIEDEDILLEEGEVLLPDSETQLPSDVPQKTPESNEAGHATRASESKIHQVYGGRKYPTILGGGGVASVMGGGTDVLMHSRSRRTGEEAYIAPERTNEEALFDLDQDLAKENLKKDSMTQRQQIPVTAEEPEFPLAYELTQNIVANIADGDNKKIIADYLQRHKEFYQHLAKAKYRGENKILGEVTSRLMIEIEAKLKPENITFDNQGQPQLPWHKVFGRQTLLNRYAGEIADHQALEQLTKTAFETHAVKPRHTATKEKSINAPFTLKTK